MTLQDSSVAPKTQTKIGNLVTLKYAATGFMLLKRSALERIKSKVEEFYLPGGSGESIKLYNFFDCKVVDNDCLTEDFYFSHLFNESGGRIYADEAISLRHMVTHEDGCIRKESKGMDILNPGKTTLIFISKWICGWMRPILRMFRGE